MGSLAAWTNQLADAFVRENIVPGYDIHCDDVQKLQAVTIFYR